MVTSSGLQAPLLSAGCPGDGNQPPSRTTRKPDHIRGASGVWLYAFSGADMLPGLRVQLRTSARPR